MDIITLNPGQSVVVQAIKPDTPEPALPWVDRISEMAVNHAPDQPYLVKRGWKWWPIRGEGECPLKVTGLTIHHTCSHSPLATARYCTGSLGRGGKGYPSIQYHFWISQGDDCPVFLVADPEWALWHDNTGTYQTTLSVGMAGRLDLQKPPDEQLGATVDLVAYLMNGLDIPIEQVKGHNDHWATRCPGWHLARWRDEFYGALRDAT